MVHPNSDLETIFSDIPNFTKSDIPEMLNDTKEISMRHLIMTSFNSRKSGRHPGHEWIFIAVIVISALTLLGWDKLFVFLCTRDLPMYPTG